MEFLIEYKGVNFDIDCDFEEGYAVWINEIKHKGVCFLEVMENDFDEIKEQIDEGTAEEAERKRW